MRHRLLFSPSALLLFWFASSLHAQQTPPAATPPKAGAN